MHAQRSAAPAEQVRRLCGSALSRQRGRELKGVLGAAEEGGGVEGMAWWTRGWREEQLRYQEQ